MPDSQHNIVKQTNGVINFVYSLKKLAIITDDEIESIKNFLDTYDSIRLEKTQFNINDKAKITSTPLILKDSLSRMKSKFIKLYLPALGYQIIAEAKKPNVQVIVNSKMGGRVAS
jgi:hypothetical protein